MANVNVPIPLDDRRGIDAALEDVDDPDLANALRKDFMARAQRKANQDAQDRRRYREAREYAVEADLDDPSEYAADAVAAHRVLDRYDATVKAIFRRVMSRSARRTDRAATKQEAASKSANPSLRRHPQKDRLYVQILGEAERKGFLSNRPLVSTKLNFKIPGYKLPHWQKTTMALKVMALSIESEKEGSQTINLHPNRDVCKAALESPRGPASYMQDRIRKAMERTFGKGESPEFWFVIETDSECRFHLHGAVVTPTTPNAPKMVDAALRSAGGEWDAAGGHQHQQVSRSLDGPLGWASYVCKHMNLARNVIDRRLLASTAGIKRKAVMGWNDLRASLPQPSR
jgi:hypothetical protein